MESVKNFGFGIDDVCGIWEMIRMRQCNFFAETRLERFVESPAVSRWEDPEPEPVVRGEPTTVNPRRRRKQERFVAGLSATPEARTRASNARWQTVVQGERFRR